jgi:hypothetical protein
VLPPSYIGIQRLAETPRDVTVPFVLEPRLVVGPVSPFIGAAVQKPRVNEPTNWYIQVAGRLKPGMTREQVLGNLSGPFQESARAGMASFMSGLNDAERKVSRN